MTTLTYSIPNYHGETSPTTGAHVPETLKLATAVQAAIDALDVVDAALTANGRLVFAKGITAEDTSTGVTAGVVETIFTNKVTIPLSTLAANDRIRIRAKVKATAANSTDTLALKLRNGGLSGTILAAVAAADSTAGDEFWLTFEGRQKAIGAAVTASLNGAGNAIKLGAPTWQNATTVDDVTAVATDAAIDIVLTYQYSVSNAGNTCVIKELFVEILRPSA